MTAVVDKADEIGVEIFPSPVKTGEFAEIRVFRGNVVARAIFGKTVERRMKGGADLEGKISLVAGHGVIFVTGDDNLDGFHDIYDYTTKCAILEVE